MSFEIIRKKITLDQSSPTTFSFSGTVKSSIYGLTSFELNSDEDVLDYKEIEISLVSNPQNQNILITASANIEGLSKSESYVVVTVLAWIETASNGLLFTSSTGAKEMQQVNAQHSVSEPPLVNVSLLQGFDLAFDSGKSRSSGLGVSTGAFDSPFEQQGSRTPAMVSTTLFGGGKSSQPGTSKTDVGMITFSEAQTAVDVRLINSAKAGPLDTNSSTQVNDSENPVTSFALFINTFSMATAQGALYLNRIKVGAENISSNVYVPNTVINWSSHATAYNPEYGSNREQTAGSLTMLYIGLLGPVVNELSSTSGPAQGGNVITISGRNLTNYTGVTFGGTPATHISQHDESLKVTVPEGKAGSVEVVVTTPYGEGSSSTKYTYN